MTDAQRQQVLSILKKEIVVTTGVNEIFIHNDKVYSSQTYASGLDQDMSDFAVGYYEIIYNRKVLRSGSSAKAQFVNVLFAGDTMNTGIYESKKRHKIRLASKERHCLANFWLIPYQHGRRREKPTRDYLESYLIHVRDWIENNDDRFKKFADFSDFSQRHFLPKKIASFTIQDQIDFISRRAELIANSDKAADLWRYFNDLGLFD